MNSDQEKLSSLLQRLGNPDGAPISADEMQWIEDFKRRYPFFTIPSAIAMGNREPSLHEMVTAPSPESLARLQNPEDATRFDDFYPEENRVATPSTNSAINDFLSTYGHQSAEEDQLLERLIFNPVADYSQQLASEEENSLPTADSATGNSQDSLINRFILSHHSAPDQQPLQPAASSSNQSSQNLPGSDSHLPAAAGAEELSAGAAASRVSNVSPKPKAKSAPAKPADGLLAESLAKIYIKTRRYEQAYEILNGLSLRFPEKSSYFADQLRFLQKLILNEQRRKTEKTIEK